MIIILHGDNFTKAREVIIQLQEKLSLKISEENLNAHKKEFNISDITAEDLKAEISSFGLFDDPPFIILDISKAGRKNVRDYIEVLKEAPKETTVVVVSNKALTKSNAFIKSAKGLGAKVLENNEVPKSNVYKFIDAVFEKNKKKSYRELTNLLQDGEDEFYIFSMIMFNLRNLAMYRLDAPEAKSLAPFIKSKLSKVSKEYDQKKLAEIYDEMYKMDLKMKTGRVSKEIAIPLIIEKVTQTANIN